MKPEQLNILHLSSPKSWRGGERQLAFLVEELREMGTSQAVFCSRGSAMEKWCQQNGVQSFTFRKTFSVNPVTAWKLAKICRRHNFNRLHAHDSHSHTAAVLAASWFGCKVPLIVHRRVDFPIGGNFLSKWKYNHPSVHRIICVSHFVKNLITPALHNPEKVTVVHDGIDLTLFSKNSKPKSQNSLPAGVQGKLVTIGNVAAIAPHKDYFTFVRTAEVLIQGGLKAKFLIIGGDGGEEAAIRDFIAEKKLGEHVQMLGFRTDVLELLSQLDLLLFTSKTEGLGSSLLDAFAAGTPVVATKAGGIPEIVEHEVTGLLAPVGDANTLAKQVIRMLNDDALRERILANAKEKVKSISKRKMAEKTIVNYEL